MPSAPELPRRAHIDGAALTVGIFVVLVALGDAAIGIPSPLYPVIAAGLKVSEAAVGFVTAGTILIVGFSSVAWGYMADLGTRRRLLIYGTLVWSAAFLLTGFAHSYVQFVASQVIAALGLGGIRSVGFSAISDLVAPQRRGLMLGLWGVSQGIGTGLGIFLGGALGAEDWHTPFLMVAGSGFVGALLCLAAYEPQRGQAEHELGHALASGKEYPYTIEPADILRLVAKPSNRWLIAEGLTSQIAYGSLLWLPRLFTAKAQAEGYGLATAIIVGTLLALLFQIGGAFSVIGGHLGDMWQRRDPRGRALLSTIGILGAVPFYLAMFFLPMHGLDVPDGGSTWAILGALLRDAFTNPWVAGAFFLGLFALALTGVDSPNWLALINDVNLPEHRGTVFGLGNLSINSGRAVGNALTGLVFASTTVWFYGPVGFAVGLAIFQVFFLPTGLFYYRLSKTAPEDIAKTRRALAARSAAMHKS